MKVVRKRDVVDISDERLMCDFCSHTDRTARVIFRNTLNRAGICSECVELFMLKLVQLDTDTTTKPPNVTRH